MLLYFFFFFSECLGCSEQVGNNPEHGTRLEKQLACSLLIVSAPDLGIAGIPRTFSCSSIRERVPVGPTPAAVPVEGANSPKLHTATSRSRLDAGFVGERKGSINASRNGDDCVPVSVAATRPAGAFKNADHRKSANNAVSCGRLTASLAYYANRENGLREATRESGDRCMPSVSCV